MLQGTGSALVGSWKYIKIVNLFIKKYRNNQPKSHFVQIFSLINIKLSKHALHEHEKHLHLLDEFCRTTEAFVTQ